jgi:uncharacterized protein (TIGR02145 family)
MKTKKILFPVLTALAVALMFFACKKEKDEPDPIVEFPESVTDSDGNVYEVVVIGSQAWMKQNLQTTHYADGSPIQTDLSDNLWEATGQGAFAIYPIDLPNSVGIGSKEDMKAIYGLLYNWHAVNDSRGLCPDEWKVPSGPEWRKMLDFILENHEDVTQQNIGNALKSCRQVDSPLGGDCNAEWGEHPFWFLSSEEFGNNLVGFNALPAGSRNRIGEYSSITGNAIFWESTHGTETTAPARYLNHNIGDFQRGDFFHNNGLSVRCIWKGE